MRLSILCVTQYQSYSLPFLTELDAITRLYNRMSGQRAAELVILADGVQAAEGLAESAIEAKIVTVHSHGYLESVLETGVSVCQGDYIFRVDDDESCSTALISWLMNSKFLAADHWKFPRLHLWGNTRQVIMTPHLFPDHQTRLSVKAKSGGRHTVHAGSPFGGGEIAPCAILHHKFLVKSYDQRLAIAQTYDRFGEGYGTGSMAPFSLPERAYDGEMVKFVEAGQGNVPWVPRWVKELRMRNGQLCHS